MMEQHWFLCANNEGSNDDININHDMNGTSTIGYHPSSSSSSISDYDEVNCSFVDHIEVENQHEELYNIHDETNRNLDDGNNVNVNNDIDDDDDNASDEISWDSIHELRSMQNTKTKSINTNEEISRDDCHIQQAMHNNNNNNIINMSICEILDLIKLYPMEVYHQNILGDYPLHTSCYYCLFDVAMRLMECFPGAAKYPNSSGLYPLHLVIMNMKLENDSMMSYTSNYVIMKLIELFPDAVFVSTQKVTLLHFACKNNLSEIVITKLIEINPLAIQEKDYMGRYPIHYAISTDQSTTIIKLLLDNDPLGLHRRAENHFSGNVTPLLLACLHDNVDLVKYFIMKRTDLQINVRDSDGLTPLHYACNDNKDQIVNVLLQHPDIDVNAIDQLNDTPLHKTLKFQFNIGKAFHIFHQLLDHPSPIDINHKNNDNQTLLDLIQLRINEFDEDNDNIENRDDSEEEMKDQCFVKIIYLLKEYPIKQRWKSYCYHFNNINNDL